MVMTLFDFDYSEEQAIAFSDNCVKTQFEVLRRIQKERMNGYHIPLEVLPRGLIPYLEKFEDRDWIKRKNNGIYVVTEYLDFHTAREVIEKFRQRVNAVLEKPNVNWYKNVLPVLNANSIPIRVKNDETEKEMERAIAEIRLSVAKKLGLNHFLENPSSMGIKMNPFSTRWVKDNVLPMILDRITPITNFEEMEMYFYHHAFFFGRSDWDANGTPKGIRIAPYPEFRGLLLSDFELVCLCEATDRKTVKEILNYCGTIHYGLLSGLPDDQEVIYPEGWSWGRYKKSLTEDDKKIIKADWERLNTLHCGHMKPLSETAFAFVAN